MARIEGTGIKTPSDDSQKMAKVYYGGLEAEKRRQLKKDIDKFMRDFGGTPASDPFNPKGRGMGDRFDPTAVRPNFFSPGGGAFDERNNVQVASASGDFSGTFNESDYQGYTKALGIRNYKGLPSTMKRMLRENYQDDVRDGRYKEGQLINKKPSFVEQTKNFAGSLFNAITGTQPAAASQIPGGMPTGTQFTSSNLDAAKATTGDTSFASYRMAGQPPKGEQKQEGSGIVTPFSQTSMGKGEPVKVTPFSETSMGKGEPVKVTPFRQTSMGNKTVTVDGQKVAARQTVASLPSDYKQTEAREFAKAAAFQQAKKNPNVTVGVDSKGQPVAKAVQKSRTEAGASARTAEGNKARVQQNARARAQAAAVNRKMSGRSISQTKAANQASMRQRASERNKAFQAAKKAGTLSKSARTAAGQRARNKAAAKARAKAAAKRRRSKKSGKKCDIFLKYNISPLTNMNLIRDDLAEVAYFVKELQA